MRVGQLLDRIPLGDDPLGPDNILAFMSGLRTGCGMRLKVCPAMAISGKPRNCQRVEGAACGRIGFHGAVLDAIGRKCARIRRRASSWPRPLIDHAGCVNGRAGIDACPTGGLAVAFNQDAADRRARPVLVRLRDGIACRL